MRLTVLAQMAKSLPAAADRSVGRLVSATQVGGELERVKWFLWHGNVFRALQVLDDLGFDLDNEDPGPEQRAFGKRLAEFRGYIDANGAWIPNYGERHRCGEAISSAFVESAVNQVVSKRMAKKQQMRWSPRGAHLLLQVRTRVLNGDLTADFRRWYPGLTDPRAAQPTTPAA